MGIIINNNLIKANNKNINIMTKIKIIKPIIKLYISQIHFYLVW